jgi:hypothetical protein
MSNYGAPILPRQPFPYVNYSGWSRNLFAQQPDWAYTAAVSASAIILSAGAGEALGGLGASGASTSETQPLVHLTDTTGLSGITDSQTIIGNHGIFAVPESVAEESTLVKVLRTGLTPSRTAEAVPIPDAAAGIFQSPTPIGPYSAWKYFGGVQYTSPGSISTVTGAFTPSSTIVGPNMLIYGPDVLFYGGVGTAGGLYWYGTSGKK